MFKDGSITVGAALTTDKANIEQAKGDIAQAYPFSSDTPESSLCVAVNKQAGKMGYLSGIDGCKDAASSCRWVARDNKVKTLEATITDDQAAVDKIQKQIDAVDNRESNMEDTDCAECQASYYGTGAGSLTKLGGTALVINSLMPGILGGLGPRKRFTAKHVRE